MKLKYIINLMVDLIILAGIIITILNTNGEYLAGIWALISAYIIMVTLASLAQRHNHNGIFGNPKITLLKGILFNLLFLFTKII